MALLLLAAFVGIPILEIAVFIQVGGLIGLVPTLVVVVLTAVMGTALLRHQGLATLGRARATVEAGSVPVREVFDGVCLLVAGILLLTPGFVTDALGFALMVPPVRGLLIGALVRRAQVHVEGQRAAGATWAGGSSPPGGFGPGTGPGSGPGGAGPAGGSRSGPVIDGDFVEVDPEPGSPREDSPWRGGGGSPPAPGG